RRLGHGYPSETPGAGRPRPGQPCPRSSPEVARMPTANRPSRRPLRVVLPSLAAACLGLLAAHRPAVAEDAPSPRAYLEFVRERAREARAGDRPPATLDEWRDRREAVRLGLLEAWGGFPAEPCPLELEVLGTLDR